ncbi:hypothetical protein ACLQ2N_21925 [Streptomyces sp. DT224]|uniref:hypothetical protein n=1 Tax=Streptomyces sp. DT224 TaxID=3393426 RepID=UPI003CE8F194
MVYLRSFIPWIALTLLTGVVDVGWAATIALALAAGLIVGRRRAGSAWGALAIECSALVFLAGYTAVAFTAPDSATVAHYGGPASSLWLAVTAWASLALRRPFTLGIARAQVPEQHWNSPLFRHVNRVITAVWALAFTASGAGSALLHHYRPEADTARTLLTVAAFALPALFTARYPDLARARHTATPREKAAR